jgi:DNA-binding CsgD family transcriptional regulator
MARNALGLADLSANEYEKAREHLAPTFESRHGVSVPDQSLAESLPIEIEVLAHLGAIDEAEDKLRWLEGPGFPLDRSWGLGTTARCRGLIAAAGGDLKVALVELTSAVAHHQRGTRPFDLARSLFALGTVQRRHGVKREAREALQQALEIFERLGARLWAEKARAELARLGGRPAQTRDLTETERQIATLVAAGKSNHEVSRVLHLSPKTVEWNLSKIYRKLRVGSRTELAAKLAK